MPANSRWDLIRVLKGLKRAVPGVLKTGRMELVPSSPYYEVLLFIARHLHAVMARRLYCLFNVYTSASQCYCQGFCCVMADCCTLQDIPVISNTSGSVVP